MRRKLWLINGRLAMVAAAAMLLPTLTQASFQTINNPLDLNFNQLLGINNAGTIAGYFGDANVVPNNGYTWTKEAASSRRTFRAQYKPR